jgi:hypothetical protein
MTSEPFGGVIGRYQDESTAWWPPPRRAPTGAPNVLLIILDDVGFAQRAKARPYRFHQRRSCGFRYCAV